MGQITSFSFWLGCCQPKTLAFFFFPVPYGYRKNIKDVFPALEEFITWLGGSQMATGASDLWQHEPVQFCLCCPSRPQLFPFWGSRPKLGLRPQASGPPREARSNFFCLIALVLATVKEFLKLKASGE